MNTKWLVRSIVLVAVVMVSTVSVAEFYERAPDVLPGTTKEMLTAEYWIGTMDEPDVLILPLGEIRARNEKYQRWIRSVDAFENVPDERIPIPYFYPGVVFYPPDLMSLDATAQADTVRKRIGHEIDYLKGREWGNYFGVKHAEHDINALIDEMAVDRIAASSVARSGITVRTALQRNVAAQFPAMSGAGDSNSYRWDRWSMGVIAMGQPVTVLHYSKTGEFLFVLSPLGYGWLKSVDVAFATVDEIKRFTDSPRFVVCTGDRVQLYTSEECTVSTGYFRMGERLPIASKINPRLVQIPQRKINGDFTVAVAWLALDSDTHVGYLPYTRRNIVTQALKLIGNLYDFTGELMGRQHETTYRDVFASFGFVLPRTDPLFTFYGADDSVLLPDSGNGAQYKKILAYEPFVTLMSCGRHAQLIFGEHEGEPIVFDQHGYRYEDENGIMLEVKRCNIGTLMMPEYFLERNVTFLELK